MATTGKMQERTIRSQLGILGAVWKGKAMDGSVGEKGRALGTAQMEVVPAKIMVPLERLVFEEEIEEQGIQYYGPVEHIYNA